MCNYLDDVSYCVTKYRPNCREFLAELFEKEVGFIDYGHRIGIDTGRNYV